MKIPQRGFDLIKGKRFKEKDLESIITQYIRYLSIMGHDG